MTDINSTPSDRLKAWLETVTDPNKDPWTSDQWRGLDILQTDQEEEEEEVPIDPTLGREEEDDCVLVGERDSQGRPDGNVSLSWSNGDSFKGQYAGGEREGWGIVSSPSNHILALTGVWTRGWLEGKGRLVTKKTTVYEAWFRRSCYHGPVRVIEMKKFRMFRQAVTWLGCYRLGRVVGWCWQWCEGGGWLAGQVDSLGDLTGDNIAFLYPDLTTGLLGQFSRGEAVSARPATVSEVRIPAGGLAELRFSWLEGEAVSQSVSTRDTVGPQPLVRDPYESSVCEVRSSLVETGGEGLFAVRNINQGEIVAFYNGIRLPYKPGEKEDWESSGYKIFINADHSSGERIDLPGDLIKLTNYAATLGHKMNHSFDYNCREWFCQHPRHGIIPCALAARDIKEGEELFLHYGYDPNNCPAWYRLAVERYLSQHPDLDIWQVVDPNRLEAKKKTQWEEEEEYKIC